MFTGRTGMLEAGGPHGFGFYEEPDWRYYEPVSLTERLQQTQLKFQELQNDVIDFSQENTKKHKQRKLKQRMFHLEKRLLSLYEEALGEEKQTLRDWIVYIATTMRTQLGLRPITISKRLDKIDRRKR